LPGPPATTSSPAPAHSSSATGVVAATLSSPSPRSISIVWSTGVAGQVAVSPTTSQPPGPSPSTTVPPVSSITWPAPVVETSTTFASPSFSV
jgi:hypothetical protein